MTTYTINQSMMPRWLAVAPAALSVTFCLLLLMKGLIFREYVAIPEEETVPIPEIHWQEREPVVVIDNKIKRPDPPPRAPQRPKPDSIEVKQTVVIPGNAYTPKPPTDIELNFGSRMAIAQVMLSPKYPIAAIKNGTEGYVDVAFDVSENGIPENIVVLSADPVGIFEKAAIKAVSRWRFLPKLEGGKAIPSFGLSQRIRFQMDQ